jgi:microcystin-dependent protein
MTTPFVGEIRMFGFPRIPVGWQACDGSLLPISQYETLYTLLGTTYGGNGVTNFGVPDLRGALPMHQGNGPGRTPRVIGQRAGTEQITLNFNQMPLHSHLLTVSTQPSTTATPGATVFLATGATADQIYFTPPTGGTQELMSTNTCQNNGGGLGHDNCAPTLTVSICIAWAGIFPSQG